jgi:ABC-2 type transport system ATP-binding protein
VEQMLDHILMLDQHSVLLNASMQEIQDAYTFEFRSPQQMDDTVLYAEPTLQGNAVITKRQEGDAETQVNLELLFNYKTTPKTGPVL